MIINARAAAALAFLGGRQAADIAPIILGPEQRHVVRHTHPGVVKIHDFLVETPELRHLGHVGIDFLGDDFPLHVHDFFEQRHVRLRPAVGHRRVVRAAQTDGDDALIHFVAPDAFAPESLEDIRLLGVVPTAQRFLITAIPFLLRPQHRLLMRSAHHDAVFIRQHRIVRVVFVEGVVPHRRPEIITLQPQNQLEQIGVKAAPVIGHARRHRRIGAGRHCAIFLVDPVAQIRRLVVQKNAAIFHRRRPLHKFSGLHKQFVVMRRRHVRPIIPGRNADLFGQIINAVNRPAFVAAADDQRAVHAAASVWARLESKTIPICRRWANRQFSFHGSAGQ